MKYVCKVIDVNPTKRIATAVFNDGRIFNNINIIKNGQPMPSVGNLIIVDDSLFSTGYPFYISLGTIDISSKKDSDFDIPQQTAQEGMIQFDNTPIPSYEKDWNHYNPIFNSFIGTSGNITALVNDIIGLVLNSSTGETEIKTGQLNIVTNNFEVQLDDTAGGVPIFRFSGTLAEGIKENKFILEVNPQNINSIVKLSITSSSEGDIFAIYVDHEGKISLDNKSGVQVNTGSFISNVTSFALNSLSDLSIDAGAINIKCASLTLAIVSSVTAAVLGKVSVSSQDSINMNAPEIVINASGDMLSATPMSKKLVIKSSNGSILITTPLIDNPAANSSILMTTGFADQIVEGIPAITKGIGIFSSFPGGIVIGGPIPTPIGINSFVKYNEFAVLISGLITAITAFAAAQATASASGTVISLVPGFTALAAAMGALLPLIITCRSFYTTTGEP